jgi:rod shape determining protein RodA
MKHRESLNTIKFLAVAAVLLSIPLFLVYSQPNLSTSIMIFIVFCSLLFVGGLSYKIILTVLSIVIPVIVVLFIIVLQPEQQLIRDYQAGRILAWLQPNKYADTLAYQQLNSITAIGSGQLWGKGLNNNVIASVKNGNFISEPQNDFIFAVIGEEMGFVGAVSCILLVLFIVLECINIARQSKDLAGSVIACGMASLIGFQSFLNMSVATGVLPNTGIPFPFVSYGLTSLVSLYSGIGIVLNIRLQCKKY